VSVEDHAMLFDIRERIARIESRQVHILELLQDHKQKMNEIESEANTLKGKVWITSTIIFAALAAVWEIIKARLFGSH